MPAWIPYTLLRLTIFGVVCAALILAGIVPWLAALFGVLISFTVSYIFFPALRNRVAYEFAARYKHFGKVDEQAEDGDGGVESS